MADCLELIPTLSAVEVTAPAPNRCLTAPLHPVVTKCIRGVRPSSCANIAEQTVKIVSQGVDWVQKVM